MLTELVVRDLGVISEVALVLGPGTTALTGETGAGKTLLVDAIDLLCGGRADASRVRSGADEASVEARFVVEDDEIVVRRVVPRDGRSRAYVDGRLATATSLVELAWRLVDLHGQHDHQSLLRGAAQRGALDRFAGVELGVLVDARQRRRALAEQLESLGGDARGRARELDLLRFQLDEIETASPRPDEDGVLDEEETLLADATAHREAAAAASSLLADDDGIADQLAAVLALLDGRSPFADACGRLLAVQAELDEAARDLRDAGEAIDEDPERLEVVRQRRQQLRDLTRKYGETLGEVVAYADDLRARIDELERHDERAAALDAEIAALDAEIADLEHRVGEQRRQGAAPLAEAVQRHLGDLALPHARLDVRVGPDPGDDVTFLLAANPGTEPLPLAKVASGGELARVMLALRLVLTAGPPTLVFDEVDAGIGGATALAVGQSLAALGERHQVLVVTHLPQVAAFADRQVAVTKEVVGDRTVTQAAVLDADARVVELSRMLSGTPDSATARDHAQELLASAATERAASR